MSRFGDFIRRLIGSHQRDWSRRECNHFLILCNLQNNPLMECIIIMLLRQLYKLRCRELKLQMYYMIASTFAWFQGPCFFFFFFPNAASPCLENCLVQNHGRGMTWRAKSPEEVKTMLRKKSQSEKRVFSVKQTSNRDHPFNHSSIPPIQKKYTV